HRVAALQADDVLPFERALEDERMDGRSVRARALAASDRDELGVLWGEREHLRTDELVVGHDAGGREEAVRAHGEELGIARPRAHEEHSTLRREPDTGLVHDAAVPHRRAMTRSTGAKRTRS